MDLIFKSGKTCYKTVKLLTNVYSKSNSMVLSGFCLWLQTEQTGIDTRLSKKK